MTCKIVHLSLAIFRYSVREHADPTGMALAATSEWCWATSLLVVLLGSLPLATVADVICYNRIEMERSRLSRTARTCLIG